MAVVAGEQVITVAVDPDRAAALIAKFKSSPGVITAGWTSGMVEMDRAIRFAAADWRDRRRSARIWDEAGLRARGGR